MKTCRNAIDKCMDFMRENGVSSDNVDTSFDVIYTINKLKNFFIKFS